VRGIEFRCEAEKVLLLIFLFLLIFFLLLILILIFLFCQPGCRGTEPNGQRKPAAQFLLCVQNEGYPVSLECRKVYRTIPDAKAETRKFVRVVDESGEDYLCPASYFVPIDLPQRAAKAFVEAS
jgi:hypothetical protein